jgi:hypothetical protein
MIQALLCNDEVFRARKFTAYRGDSVDPYRYIKI